MLVSRNWAIYVGKLIVLIDNRGDGASKVTLTGVEPAGCYAIQDCVNYTLGLHITGILRHFTGDMTAIELQRLQPGFHLAATVGVVPYMD